MKSNPLEILKELEDNDAQRAANGHKREYDLAVHLALVEVTKDTVIFLLGKMAGTSIDLENQGQGLHALTRNVYSAYAKAHLPAPDSKE